MKDPMAALPKISSRSPIRRLHLQGLRILSRLLDLKKNPYHKSGRDFSFPSSKLSPLFLWMHVGLPKGWGTD